MTDSHAGPESGLPAADLLAPDFARSGGLLPAVAQDIEDGAVLMLAWMSPESLARTLATGYATYFSRSRNALWVKGETSGHLQRVASVHLDCDGDALLLRVHQVGAACHEGFRTCFFRTHGPRGFVVDQERVVASPGTSADVKGDLP